MRFCRLVSIFAFCAAACLASSVQFNSLSSVHLGEDYSSNNATYDGFVTATVDSVAGQYLICDDSVDTTNVPSGPFVFDYSVLANDISGGTLTDTHLRFYPASGAVTLYEEAALLLYDFAQLGSAATNPQGTAQQDTVVDYQYVLWGLFNTGVNGNTITLNNSQKTLLGTVQGQLSNTALLTAALKSTAVYSPADSNQEFLQYVTPEPGSMVLIGAGLMLACLATRQFARRP